MLPVFFSNKVLLTDLLNSLILAAAIMLVRLIVNRMILKTGRLTVQERRQRLITTRNVCLVLLITGLVFIWGRELRTFAFSLFAVAAALVVATKELIMCVSGSFLRLRTRAFNVGDRIEVGPYRGYVVDTGLLATTLLEAGPGRGAHRQTGRAFVIPNSLLLNTPVMSENYMGAYVVHVVTIPLATCEDWARAEQILLEAAQAECAPFTEAAERHMATLEKKRWIETPSVLPRVSLEMPEKGRINLLLRIPAPARQARILEQQILRRFLTAFYVPEPPRSSQDAGPRPEESRGPAGTRLAG